MGLNTNSEKFIDFHLEWVNRPLRSGATGYYRRVPGTRADPTMPQAQARLAFSEIATGTHKIRGTTETWDHREISRNADHIGNQMRNRKFKQEGPELTKWERILCKLLAMK